MRCWILYWLLRCGKAEVCQAAGLHKDHDCWAKELLEAETNPLWLEGLRFVDPTQQGLADPHAAADAN